MSSESKRAAGAAVARRALLPLTLTFLLTEFMDEVVDGVRVAAWPLIREDLRLSYTEIGAVLTVPALVGNLVEPWIYILADVWRRRALALAGGVAFAVAALLVGLSYSFAALLVAFTLFSPASGAFVNLSQASLMDAEPGRREQNMARWTLAGSLGNLVGPLVVAAGAGWRGPFVGLAFFSLAALALASRVPFPTPAVHEGGARAGLAEGLREAGRALRRRAIWRWLVLLEVGNLTADILYGFLALYFADVVGAGEAGAAFAVVVWMCVGLPGDFLLLPLLERVRGVNYLRVSTAAQVVLFPAFLLAEGYAAKLVLLGLLGLANAGWYAILKARLYAAMPGRSGTALTLHNLSALAGCLFPLALGAFAERYGLASMMWLIAAGPPLLLVGLLTVRADEGEGGTMNAE